MDTSSSSTGPGTSAPSRIVNGQNFSTPLGFGTTSRPIVSLLVDLLLRAGGKVVISETDLLHLEGHYIINFSKLEHRPYDVIVELREK